MGGLQIDGLEEYYNSDNDKLIHFSQEKTNGWQRNVSLPPTTFYENKFNHTSRILMVTCPSQPFASLTIYKGDGLKSEIRRELEISVSGSGNLWMHQ